MASLTGGLQVHSMHQAYLSVREGQLAGGIKTCRHHIMIVTVESNQNDDCDTPNERRKLLRRNDINLLDDRGQSRPVHCSGYAKSLTKTSGGMHG